MIHLRESFRALYKEWFANKSYWFDKNPETDKYLSEKYFFIIKNIHQYNGELKNEDIQTLIGAIIAFDQIPRHHKRLDTTINCATYTETAVNISLYLMIQCSENHDLYDSISAIEWCFILLPIRHTNNCHQIISIIDFIIKKHNSNCSDDDKQIYKRFLKATIENIYKRVTQEFYVNPQTLSYEIDVNMPNQWNSFQEVLQHIPKNAINFDIPGNNTIINEFKEELNYIKNQNIIVSLSGGVDSCVCLYLVKQFMPYNHIVAVHINYNNREESQIELEFVQKFCAVMQVKLYYRTIDEIKRDQCHQQGLRELYEDLTREIRFDMYKQVASARFQETATLVALVALVVLGHNKDDCFENIITNISLKKNFENLAGVSRLSMLNNIHFWRPLLNIRKIDIIHFAMSANIPFLQNSTPSWSARGKIRDVILPALQNINPDIMSSFFHLKDYLLSSDESINTFVIQQIMDKFVVDQANIKCTLKPCELICQISIWTKIFQQPIFLSLFRKNISYKSISEFVKYLERFKEHFDTIHINKKIKYILNPHTYSIIYKTTNNMIQLEFTPNNP